MDKVYLVISDFKIDSSIICHGACPTMEVAIALFKNICRKAFSCKEEKLDELCKKKLIRYESIFRDVYITPSVLYVSTVEEAEKAE